MFENSTPRTCLKIIYSSYVRIRLIYNINVSILLNQNNSKYGQTYEYESKSTVDLKFGKMRGNPGSSQIVENRREIARSGLGVGKMWEKRVCIIDCARYQLSRASWSAFVRKINNLE